MCLFCNNYGGVEGGLWGGLWGYCWSTTPSALTLVLHQRFQLLPQALVPARDVDVQGVIAAGLAVGAPAPLLVGSQQTGPSVRADVVNWGNTAQR